MRVLFISALLPYPPHQGGQVRLYNLLKNLTSRHEITLLSFIRSDDERQFLKKLSFCRRVVTVMRGHAWQPRYVLKAAFGLQPFLYVTYDHDEMRQKISGELASSSYDLVHLEPSYVWPSLPQTNVPVVATEHNIESTIYAGFVRRFPLVILRPALYWDVLKLRFWEQRVWKRVNHVITVSESDANVVRAAISPNHVSVVPNGVDPTKFAFRQRKKFTGKRVLFVGYFGWLQNRDALADLLEILWPKISHAHPSATLRVIGKKLPRSLLQKLTAVGGSYTEVVDDIVGEYHAADVLLAPIRIGGGTRYKILDAMATGLPVVTTTVGANGLLVRHRKELLVADGVEATVRALSTVFKDDGLRQTMTARARQVVEKNYSWDQLAKKLEGVWQHVKKPS